MDIKRKYEDVLESRLSEKNPLIQVLVGPRQVGKSTAAASIASRWDGERVVISADGPSPPPPAWIRQHWEDARRRGAGTLLIIDEVQKVPGWSGQVKLLFDQDRGKADLRILLLGSSSLFLQRGLGESLAGRFELLEAPHWSWQEFTQAFGWDFDTYLRFGAYPGAVAFHTDESRWRAYIRHSIIEPVLGQDILGLHPVQKPALFRQAFEMAVHYPAQIVSYQKMLGQLQERGNAATIQHYLRLMEQGFLFRVLQKYSGSTVRLRGSIPKIVVLNPALTHAFESQSRLTTDTTWYGLLFESVVGMHLARVPHADLYYWRDGHAEVDYVLKTPKNLWAIEVKSGRAKSLGRGLEVFFRKYPKARCVQWDRDQCLALMRGEMVVE